MSKPNEAKSDRTRRRILDAAAAAFRERGVDRVGIRDVMESAGLTRGGFYFHFADKDALLDGALREAGQSNAAYHRSWVDGVPGDEQLSAFIEHYLSEEHRDHPERGCLVATLGGEVGRAELRQRRAFTAGTDFALEWVSGQLPGETATERRARASLLMASMAGVVMASRALSDRDRSDALLADARQFYTETFVGA